MKYKPLSSFIRGLIEHEGIESKIGDKFLVKLQNIDVDKTTGKLVRRRGYDYWSDLKDNNSIQSPLAVLPDVSNGSGFGSKIQTIFSYTDVAGVHYNFLSVSGRIFVEKLNKDGDKQWYLLNERNILDEKNRHIDIKSYLDSVIINDVKKNVKIYNVNKPSTENRFIYFAGDTIYFRNYSDFSISTAEDIFIEDDTENPQGKAIYDSLVDIEYIKVGGTPGTDCVITDPADLKLGYCVKAGSEDEGYSYFVIDNAKNQRADEKVQIIKFNDRFIAQGYVEFDSLDSTFNIVNFDWNGDYVYLFCQDGQVEKIAIEDLSVTQITIANICGITNNDSSKKQYAIACNNDGFFIYTTGIPSLTDWFNAVFIKNEYSITPFLSDTMQEYKNKFYIFNLFARNALSTYNIYIRPNTNFAYNRNGENNFYSNIYDTYGTEDYENSTAFYLWRDQFDARYFSSLTTSYFVLVCGFDYTGTFLYKEMPEGVNAKPFGVNKRKWRYMFPIGKREQSLNVLPIQIKEDYLYFGDSLVPGVGIIIPNNGKYFKVKISDIKDNEFELWNWERPDPFKFYTGHLLFDSLVQKTISVDRIINIANSNFLFMRDGADSDQFKISNDGVYANGVNLQDDYTDLSTYNSNLVLIEKKQPVELEEGEMNVLKNLGTPKKLQVTIAHHDSAALTPGTKYRYQMAFQFYSGQISQLSDPSNEILIPADDDNKITVSGITNTDENGVIIYATEDIEYIRVYRSEQIDDANDYWSNPTLLTSIANADIGTTTTFDDTDASPAYAPYAGDILDYPVNDIEVHKNRLILINRVDYDQPNVIMYSEVDLVQAIAPDQIRSIEPGDGDYLVAGKSTADYLYLFKANRVYAILGDVPTGQMIDVSKNTGCKFKNMICEYKNTVFFLNEKGIYSIYGYVLTERLPEFMRNYFDPNRNDCIDFEHLDDNGFATIDIDRREVRFHVPQKIEGKAQTNNNLVIIYSIDTESFKTYTYAHDIFYERIIKDIETGLYKTVLSDYNGNVYELSNDVNDDGRPIEYIVRTKDFNIDTNMLSKSFKIFKVHGRYIKDLHVAFWINGERQHGDFIVNDSNMVIPVINGRGVNTMMIEMSGKDHSKVPFEVDELLIGYEQSRSFR